MQIRTTRKADPVFLDTGLGQITVSKEGLGPPHVSLSLKTYTLGHSKKHSAA